MAPSAGLWAPIAMRLMRHAFKKTSNIIKVRVEELARLNGELQPILLRSSPRQPVHPVALLRQRKGRWYTTHSTLNAVVRRFMSTGRDTIKYNRGSFPKSATATAISRLTTRAPFASALRPNLTGGALSRTSGGYSLGGGRVGGARYFSHTPAAPAQVVNNVSAAVRAFWLSGHKAQFEGMTPAGEKSYRSITNLQEETSRKMNSVLRTAPGSYIDFPINPTITALTPLGAQFPFGSVMEAYTPHLNTEGFLDILSVDFARALKDFSVVMNDLKRLSSLGDLLITLERNSILRVRFPGCDAGIVERLCDEVGVQRGIIYQDENFENSAGTHMALLFPYAPMSERDLSSPGGSLRSQSGHDFEAVEEEILDSPWLDGYENMDSISEGESAYFSKLSPQHNSTDYEGLEGIYRFIEQCDSARRI